MSILDKIVVESPHGGGDADTGTTLSEALGGALAGIDNEDFDTELATESTRECGSACDCVLSCVGCASLCWTIAA